MSLTYLKNEKGLSRNQKHIKNNNNNILGGDFNMVEKIQKDRAEGNPTTQHYGLEYIENIKENNMIDIWRRQNQLIIQQTLNLELTDSI